MDNTNTAVIKEFNNESTTGKVVYINNIDEIRDKLEYHRSQVKFYAKKLAIMEAQLKEPKLRKDGCEKQTQNNMAEDRWVQGFDDINDINNIVNLLLKRVDDAKTPAKKKSAMKDLILFVTGINTGYRVSDLLNLKWKDLYTDDTLSNAREYRTVQEKKTKKRRKFYINDAMEYYLGKYVEMYRDEIIYDSYIFSKTGKTPYSKQKVALLIKGCTEELGIKGNYNTHSLRKTYALHMKKYFDSIGENGQRRVQALFGHSNDLVTLTYLGITQDETSKATKDINLGKL